MRLSDYTDYTLRVLVNPETQPVALALLEADYVSHQHDDLGHSLPTQGDAWESVAHKLCGS